MDEASPEAIQFIDLVQEHVRLVQGMKHGQETRIEHGCGGFVRPIAVGQRMFFGSDDEHVYRTRVVTAIRALNGGSLEVRTGDRENESVYRVDIVKEDADNTIEPKLSSDRDAFADRLSDVSRPDEDVI